MKSSLRLSVCTGTTLLFATSILASFSSAETPPNYVPDPPNETRSRDDQTSTATHETSKPRAAGPDLLDLSTWEQYDTGISGGEGTAVWQFSDSGTTAEQIINADATFLLGDFDISGRTIEGQWRVNTANDDDWMGFVFGYQDPHRFYLFSWKQGTQNPPMIPGMALRVIEVPPGESLTREDIAFPCDGGCPPAVPCNVTSHSTILRQNCVGWSDNTDYDFSLQFLDGYFIIEVFQGETLLESWEVQDDTYTNGRFGFYNYSQDHVRYQGFTDEELQAPDLTVANVDAVVSGDWQTLQVAGAVTADVSNTGSLDAPDGAMALLFEDRNFNRIYDPGTDLRLDEQVVPAVPTGGTVPVSFDVAATLMYRDSLLYVFVDSEDVVPELNEDNNLDHSGTRCALSATAARTWTLDADFALGTRVNVNYDPPNSDQLQLSDEATPFPFINVAASDRGTMVRVDVNTGEIIGEYRTAPQGRATNPSRTTVDLFGNVWVGNRDEASGGQGSVVKIGLVLGGTRVNADGTPNPDGEYLAPPFDYNTCIDRDGDGLIRTSRGLGSILDWPNITDGVGAPPGQPALVEDAFDECILVYQRTSGTNNRHVTVNRDNDVWVGGRNNFGFDLLDGDTGQILSTFNVGSGGYGGLIDGDGVIWSVRRLNGNNLLRYETQNTIPVDDDVWTTLSAPQSYGLAIDSAGFIWNTQYANGVSGSTVRKFAPDGTLVGEFATGGSGCPTGATVSPADDHLWIANRGPNSTGRDVSRLDNDGNLLGAIDLGNDGRVPTGMAVDANGKIWATCYTSDTLKRIDPTLGSFGAVDLTVSLGANAGPYNYSDMTGTVLLSAVQQGSWNVVHDTGIADTDDSRLRWSASTPIGTEITVSVRAANDPTNLPAQPFVPVANGLVPDDVSGQYWEIQVSFRRDDPDFPSPVLYDLTIEPDPVADLTASYLRFACGAPTRHVTARIGNGGGATAPAGVPVSFYDDDPSAGGALLGTVHTSFPLPAGVFADLTLELPTWFDCQDMDVWVVADDAGGLAGTIDECNEENNLHAATAGAVFDQFTDASLAVVLEYMDTTYDPGAGQLQVMARARNASDRPIDAPLIMVIESFSTAGAGAANPDGYTPDGQPYYALLIDVPSTLEPGAYTDERRFIFDTGDAQLSFNASYLAQDNEAPFFTSFPVTSIVRGQAYAYDADAVDPDLHPLTYTLPVGPDGMTIDADTGAIAWTAPDALGAWAVTVRADDDRGGVAEQRFTVTTTDAPQNRPPFIITSPITHASVGAVYDYRPEAGDPDGDDVTFTVTSSAPGLAWNEAQGSVAWDYALPSPTAGDWPVTLRAEDPDGAFTEQSWILTVGTIATNPHAPMLFGTPATVAAVDQSYLFQAAASDADNDPLVFELLHAPTGMTVNPDTGRVTWTPMSTGSADVELIVSDGRGGVASLAWTIQVLESLPNTPPVIESIPNFIAEQGQLYQYQCVASDNEGGALVWSLELAPSGMTINAATGLVTWTPSGAGPVTIGIRATDPEDAFAAQVYDVVVSPPNTPPIIGSAPDDTIVAGLTYRYQIIASDEQGQPLTYTLLDGPEGMTLNPITGLLRWEPTTADAGPHAVAVQVSDTHGGVVEQAWTITVTLDTNPPDLAVQFSQIPAFVNVPVQLCVLAGDDIGVVERTLRVGNEFVALDDAFCYTFIPTTQTTLPLEATATDAAGNVSVWTGSIMIVDPNNSVAPFIEILSPPAGTEITAPTDIAFRITDDDPGNMTWEVALRRADSNEETIIASSDAPGPPSDPVTFTFDPTLLPNDGYFLEIRARDGVLGYDLPVPYFVAGELKLGNFTTTFTDLAIPLAGIPLVVTREYDSLDTQPGEFGRGWRLGLPGRVCDIANENIPGDTLWLGSRVYITRPDGRRVAFQVNATPMNMFFPWLVNVSLTPLGGETGTLEIIGETQAVLVNPFLYASLFGDPYNPNRYRYTTREGVRYTVDEITGLQHIEDIFGNTIDVTPDGLFSSLGVAITFERDAEGRITSITEPDDPRFPDDVPGAIRYEYDAQGNLVAVIDQLENATEYFYEQAEFPNYLTRIEDPLGRPVIRSVFDSEGRLLAQCGPGGNIVTLDNCIEFAFDPGSSLQTIINADGDRLDLIVDTNGNVLKERKFSAEPPFLLDTDLEYDNSGQLISLSEPSGDTMSFDRLGDGQFASYEAFDGREVMFVSDACGIRTEIDPTGNITYYQYDADCQLIAVEDSLGNLTTITYTDAGQVESLTDAANNTWLYEYDLFGYPSRTVDPLGNELIYEYDISGQLRTLIDRKGQRIDYEYDSAGNLVEERWHSDPPRIISYTYTANGELASAADGVSSIDIDYWGTGLPRAIRLDHGAGFDPVLVEYVDDSNGSPTQGYDSSGHVTTVVDSLGGRVEYQYDSRDNLIAMHMLAHGEHAVDDKRVEFGYNESGIIESINRFRSADSTEPIATTNYSYSCSSCESQLLSITHSNDRGIPTQAFTHVLTGNNHVAQVTGPNGNHNYAYDGLGRLLSADHSDPRLDDEWYLYDGAGNRQASHRSAGHSYSYASDGGNRLTEDDRYLYYYDPNGNLIERHDKDDNSVTSFEYDFRDRLTHCELVDGSGILVGFETYLYDPFDRRIGVVSQASTSYFAYDGGNAILKLDNSGEVSERRFFAPAFDDLLAVDTDGQTTWPLTNHIGSVVGVLDDSGELTAEYFYDSFGLCIDGDCDSTYPLMFAEREPTQFPGIYFFRARFYDALSGRFLQEDPISPHGYTYAYNNPHTYVDPTGLTAMSEYRPLGCSGAGVQTCLYVGCKFAKGIATVVYVGIAKNPARRYTQHLRKGKDFVLCTIRELGGFSHDDARAWEQSLIEAHGGPKGPQLTNSINSISKTNPKYMRIPKVTRGISRAALRRLGAFTCESCL